MASCLLLKQEPFLDPLCENEENALGWKGGWEDDVQRRIGTMWD